MFKNIFKKSPRDHNTEITTPRSRKNSQEIWADRRVYAVELVYKDVKELESFLFTQHSAKHSATHSAVTEIPVLETEGMPVSLRRLFWEQARKEVGKSCYPHFDSLQLTTKNTATQFLSRVCVYAVQQNRLEYLLCCLGIYEINSRLHENSPIIQQMIAFIFKEFMQENSNHQLNLGADALSFEHFGQQLNSKDIRKLWQTVDNRPHDLSTFAATTQVTMGLLKYHFSEYFPNTRNETAQASLLLLSLKGTALKNSYQLFNRFTQHGFDFVKKYELDIGAICAQTGESAHTHITHQS